MRYALAMCQVTNSSSRPGEHSPIFSLIPTPYQGVFCYLGIRGKMRVMTEIILVRHAESEMNVRYGDVVGGRSNQAELTELGRSQSRKLGDYLLQKAIQPAVVYVSEALRTQRTAVGAFGYEVPLVIDPQLNEMSQGEAENMPRREVYTAEILEQIALLQKDFKMPGGESMNEVGARMREFIDDVARKHRQDKLVVAVTSGVAIKCLIATIAPQSHAWIYGHEVPNASLTSVGVDDGHIEVNYIGTPTQ